MKTRQSVKTRVSIVMPVLNEAGTLARTLSGLELDEECELIVVDGGSGDDTAEIARRFISEPTGRFISESAGRFKSGFTGSVIESQRGRGAQLHIGAGLATGEILFFLHADCVAPPRAIDAIRATMANGTILAGAFDLAIDSSRTIFRFIEFAANLRSRLTNVPYGDQGLFMRKADYVNTGGFSPIPLMEDVEFALRLRKRGRVVFLKDRITSSPRRWEEEGIVYTTVRNWTLVFLYTVFGVSPRALKRRYRDAR
ncbi:MAG: TIGR04283 family arsenosugar biosynthesis glycosyltransferase [Nitrospirae bacterium]|nr:TIGR04283 family arsenosugar biosynthesis glycosyltransferase [Nitrospirota bacterium]